MILKQFCWLCAVIMVLPMLFGCGSSGGSKASNGLSDKELAKVMEADQEEAAKAGGFQVTAKKIVETLTGDPAAAKAARESIAGRRRIVQGDVVERSSDEGETCYVFLDGGTQNGKAYKLKFNFHKSQQPDITTMKVGENVKIMGATEGEFKDDTLVFEECSIYREGVVPNGGQVAPLALPNQK